MATETIQNQLSNSANGASPIYVGTTKPVTLDLGSLEIAESPSAKRHVSSGKSNRLPKCVAIDPSEVQPINSPAEPFRELTPADERTNADPILTRLFEDVECPPCIEKLRKFLRKTFHLVKSEVGLIILLIIYSLIGSAVFVEIEGKAEDERNAAAQNKTSVDPLKIKTRDFVDAIMNLTRCDDSRDAKGAYDALEMFLSNYTIYPVELSGERVNNSSESSPTEKIWTYYGALFFCGTIYTTVGYGHIVPTTKAGRVVTMIYAVVGIPLCLVVLGKLGQLLTRGIKHLWSFVRRFYYTGSCFRLRKKNVTWRKLSLGEKLRLRIRRRGATFTKKDIEEVYVPYNVDDKFNLPPIVAIVIAFLYVFLGAFIYTRWENWSFLDAFYFTFTSLATIGFGDVLPSHPKFFMVSGVYLLFGFSLVAMVINVVMEAVSQTITKATGQMMLVGNKVREVKEKIIKVTPIGRGSTGPVSPQSLMEPKTGGIELPRIAPGARRNSF